MLDDPSHTGAFLDSLRAADWDGTIRTDRAARTVLATDNSIYERLPEAVLEPKSLDAIAQAMGAAARHGVAIAARGGGTGTNGQSLSDSVVMDCSRHMNRILDIDADRGVAVVEPGVVLDQLNAAARPLGWMFGPTVSTATRATLGGMVSTDASGKGSRRFGRTSDHLEAAEIVLADGTAATLRDMGPEEVARGIAAGGPLAGLLSLLSEDLPAHREEVARVFPEMNRGLTGYNLKQLDRGDGGLDLTRLLAGSEGTLALIGQLTLRLTPIPKHRGAAVIGYDDCASALSAVPDLLAADPDAIEFIDDRVLRLGRGVPVWRDLSALLGELSEAGGLLFAEVSGPDAETVEAALAAVERAAGASAIRAHGVRSTQAAAQLSALASLRSEAVGLLASGDGPRRGTAFVEDAAVPPERLVDFVTGFQRLLDAEGLDYGMFGHADVGCVHVRPMLDMLSAEDRARIRPISDAVAALAERHDGLLWGEHGKGVRGEYLPERVGPALYAVMRRIKGALDPGNLLNPGKLVSPPDAGDGLLRIDRVPFRGAADEGIGAEGRAAFNRAVACNGNGACFDWSPDRTMCPSYKATRDRTQSPKGRAALIRDWQRELARDAESEATQRAAEALETSLDTCLSCQACTSLCPVHVDIPEMKARFLQARHAGRPRSLRDRMVRWMEPMTLAARRVPGIANAGLAAPPVRRALASVAGLGDLPRLAARPVERVYREAGVRMVDPGRPDLAAAPEESAILLTDSFLGVFEPAPLAAAVALMRETGLTVHATPPLALGKALHVRGYLDDFERVKARMLPRLRALSATGATLVAVEPAVVMALLRDWGLSEAGLRILSLEQCLHARRDRLAPRAGMAETGFGLLPHCTQVSADPDHAGLWREIFEAAGLDLAVEQVGCCGMAGLFGHETEHMGLSREIFDLSWAGKVASPSRRMMATGFSCRSQAKRFGGAALPHPAEVLASGAR